MPHLARINNGVALLRRGNARISLIPVAIGLLMMMGMASVFAQRPLGIDVSSIQASANWTTIKGAGISFAWCKATEGFTFNDASFTSHMANAKNAGVLIGAYHYARPDNQIGVAGAQSE